MSAGLGEHLRHIFRLKVPDIGPRLAVHDEGKGRHRTIFGRDLDPARHAVGRLRGEFAAEQLSHLGLQGRAWKPVENSLALPSPVERHHKAGAILRGPKAGDPEAEGAVPSMGRAPPRLHMLHLRLPDQ